MYFPITSWLRAAFAVRQSAIDGRGAIEIPNGDDDPIRWPRTTNADVIAVASVIDPTVREQSLRFGGHGLGQRWRACVDDLERLALCSPTNEYPENREFWNTVPAMCVYLHSAGASLPPPAIWNALCAQLAERQRNAGPKGDGPFKHFDGVKTFDELFDAQFKYLRDQRGFDKLKPDAGTVGPERITPRSTNADVIALADYWNKQFQSARHVFDHAAVEAQWKTAFADVDTLARHADPNVLYPKNYAFWRALQKTAIQIAVADEAPTNTDLAIAAIKDSVEHLPENIKAGADALGRGIEQVAHGVGSVANEAGKGLLSGLGVPLLIGGGALAAVLLFARRESDKTER